MSWPTGAAKRQEWSERLRRFSKSGLTVAAFCDQERISAPSFYQWRRKLDAPVRTGTPAHRRESASPPRSHAFVPLQITQAAAVVRVRLPNGVEVWLPAGDPAMLAAAIAAAGRLATVASAEVSC